MGRERARGEVEVEVEPTHPAEVRAALDDDGVVDQLLAHEDGVGVGAEDEIDAIDGGRELLVAAVAEVGDADHEVDLCAVCGDDLAGALGPVPAGGEVGGEEVAGVLLVALVPGLGDEAEEADGDAANLDGGEGERSPLLGVCARVFDVRAEHLCGAGAGEVEEGVGAPGEVVVADAAHIVVHGLEVIERGLAGGAELGNRALLEVVAAVGEEREGVLPLHLVEVAAGACSGALSIPERSKVAVCIVDMDESNCLRRGGEIAGRPACLGLHILGRRGVCGRVSDGIRSGVSGGVCGRVCSGVGAFATGVGSGGVSDGGGAVAAVGAGRAEEDRGAGDAAESEEVAAGGKARVSDDHGGAPRFRCERCARARAGRV